MYLPSMTWKECADLNHKDLVALQPLGSTEQHGSIGPLGTDFTIPHELARRVEAAFPDRVVLLPTLPYGVCPYHTAFAGTIDIGVGALASVLSSVVRDLARSGLRRFIFLNGHGGNDPAIDTACFKAWEAGGLGAAFNWWSIVRELNHAWGGGHGGGQEAAVMMALRPEWVHKEQNFVAEETFHLSDELRSTYGSATTFKGATVKILRPTEAFSKTGTFGGTDDSCAKADGQWGQTIFEAAAAYAVDFTAEFLRIDPTVRSC